MMFVVDDSRTNIRGIEIVIVGVLGWEGIIVFSSFVECSLGKRGLEKGERSATKRGKGG